MPTQRSIFILIKGRLRSFPIHTHMILVFDFVQRLSWRINHSQLRLYFISLYPFHWVNLLWITIKMFEFWLIHTFDNIQSNNAFISSRILITQIWIKKLMRNIQASLLIKLSDSTLDWIFSNKVYFSLWKHPFSIFFANQNWMFWFTN